MKKTGTVLWLIFIGLLTLFCISLLASKLLIANDCTAGESTALERQDWKILVVYGKYFSCLHTSKSSTSMTTVHHLPQYSLHFFLDLTLGLKWQGYFKYKFKRNKEQNKAPYARPQMRKSFFL